MESLYIDIYRKGEILDIIIIRVSNVKNIGRIDTAIILNLYIDMENHRS